MKDQVLSAPYCSSRRVVGINLMHMGIMFVVLISQANAQPSTGEAFPIDMTTALRLADERNLDVAIYLERVAESTAQLRQARTLAVPTLRLGASYNRQDGPLQETNGQVIDLERVAEFRGFGAGAVGAGAVNRAGLSLEIDIADAVFSRLVAEQNQTAAVATADANRHRVLLDVAAAYLELLRAQAELKVAGDSVVRANELAGVTRDFADAGEGLLADAEMASVQPLVWERRRLSAIERFEAANANLVRLLHLDPIVHLEPMETAIPVFEIYSPDDDLSVLIDQALEHRPEIAQYDALVNAAEGEYKSERYSLFVPRVSLNYSSGDFGGAPGSSVGGLSQRDDLALILYWQFDQFGFGNRGRVEEKRSRLHQTELEQQQLDDFIAAQVRQSYARLVSSREQMELTAAAAERAESAFVRNRERIFENEGLPLEALQAMQTVADVQMMNVDAVVGYSLAQIELHTALGNPVNTE
jgi:outer membrane protein TolC